MRVFIKLLYLCVVFSGFALPAAALTDLGIGKGVVPLCEPFPPPTKALIAVCLPGPTMPGCAD